MQSIGSVTLDIERKTEVVQTPRVMQLSGLFDLPPTKHSTLQWRVEMPLAERLWNIELIVGPSGCGKTTVAREAFGDNIVSEFDWPKDKSLVDGFPSGMGIKEIVGLLSSVGFSAPPAWLRPFGVLSNGEKFRVTIARALAESCGELVVIDEFTSVVDRRVAQIGSCAVAKSVRSRNARLVAVSCHYDIVDWLQPDWIYEPDTKTFQWRELHRRPEINLTVLQVDRKAWAIFRQHHYLSSDLNPSAKCFVGMIEKQPACFCAVLSFPHTVSPGWRIHRLVTLPDFQGAGVGVAMCDFVSALYRSTGKPVSMVTSHPALTMALAKSNRWKMIDTPSRKGHHSSTSTLGGSGNRLTSSFRYVGPAYPEDARRFGFNVPSQ